MDPYEQICQECTPTGTGCRADCDQVLRIKLSRVTKALEALQKKVSILFHPQLRNSRFDFNARYIRFDEAQQIPEFRDITKALENAKNFEPFKVEDWIAYRRGTGGIFLYFVPEYDYRVPRERKNHKVAPSVVHVEGL